MLSRSWPEKLERMDLPFIEIGRLLRRYRINNEFGIGQIGFEMTIEC
jgi:hypothetical protein